MCTGAILSTLDIVHDEFGWMLAFGDLVWVPFMYPIPAWYLIQHSPQWPSWVFVAIAALGIFAYYAFRQSNAERDAFKCGELPNAKFIVMRRHDGSTNKYLISGWSSLARRPNYWPDLLNSTCYSLCAGFAAPLAWIYPVMFLVLLTHRQHRIEEKGRRDYVNWKSYCDAVPYRYLPYLI